MKEQIYLILRKKAKLVDDMDIKDDTLLTELGFSSLDIAELICEIEEIFNIEISEREIFNFRTVKDIMDYVILQST